MASEETEEQNNTPAEPETTNLPDEPSPQDTPDQQPTPPQTVIEPTQPDTPTVTTPDEPASNWQYSAGAGTEPDIPAAAPAVDLEPVNWTASEFIDHQKQPTWFIGLALVAVGGSLISYVITRDIITSVAILVALGIFGFIAARPPRTLQYQLDANGVHINNKLYGYDLFKSFSVIREGAVSSIQLSPLKRLVPPLSLYYPPDQEGSITDLLASYLPHEDRTHDPIDRLMHRLRF